MGPYHNSTVPSGICVLHCAMIKQARIEGNSVVITYDTEYNKYCCVSGGGLEYLPYL